MKTLIIILLFGLFAIGCNESNSKQNKSEIIMSENLETATFGSGCFWCTEAIFERVEGVKQVTSGYAGGKVDDPTYEEVSSGKTGHAEVVQVLYDPQIVTYDELLEIFWKTHDPTTLNRQGNDVGTQYRSVIFFHNDDQKKRAEEYKKELDQAGIWDDPIVTEISPYTNYYEAERYHQDYYANNPNKGYCAFVITPKVQKFEKVFKDKLKKEVNN